MKLKNKYIKWRLIVSALDVIENGKNVRRVWYATLLVLFAWAMSPVLLALINRLL
jgi:hypothetical protein